MKTAPCPLQVVSLSRALPPQGGGPADGRDGETLNNSIILLPSPLVTFQQLRGCFTPYKTI